jgi:hypothetical protein
MIQEALLYNLDNPTRISVTDDGRLVMSILAQNRTWQMKKIIYNGCHTNFDAAISGRQIYIMAEDLKNNILLIHSDGQNWKKYTLSEADHPSSFAIIGNLGLRGFFFLPDHGKNILAFQSLTDLSSPKQWIAYAHPDCRILCAIPFETGAALCYINAERKLTLQFVDFDSQYSSAPFAIFDGSSVDRIEGFSIGKYVFVIFCAQGRLFTLRFDSNLRRVGNIFDLAAAPSSFSISTQKEPLLYTVNGNVSKFSFPPGLPVKESLSYSKCRLLSRKVITDTEWYYNTPLIQENMKEAVIL